MATNGGGIIPFSIYNGRIFLLLGREDSFDKTWHGYGKYSDFGGRRETDELNIEAVAREAYEESNGLLGPYQSLLDVLNDTNYHLKLGNFKSDFFFVHVPYVFFIDKIFTNMLSCANVMIEKLGQLGKINFDEEIRPGKTEDYLLHHGFFEKDKIKYFPLDQVLLDVYDLEKKKKFRDSFIKLIKKFSRDKENMIESMINLKIWKFNIDETKLLHPVLNEIPEEENTDTSDDIDLMSLMNS